jgi:DNA invertase Pin-like site-specific DNA recombinase
MKTKENTKSKPPVLDFYLYCRVSGEGQENGDGFTRQELACRNYAAFKKFTVHDVVHDTITGVSDWDDRDGFNHMVERMRENGVKGVLVEKVERLARKTTVQEAIIEQFEKEGFEIWSTEENQLTNRHFADVFMRQVIGARNQYDKSAIVDKLRGARQRKREQLGWCEGRKAFGYRAGEQDVIVRMKELRKAGRTYAQIADELNANDVATRTAGARWHDSSVRGILRANDGRRKRNQTAAVRSNIS